jgi:hypothetical protein
VPVAALGLDETLDGLVPDSPSVGNIQQTLVEVQQQAQSGLAVVPGCAPSELHRGSIRIFGPHLGAS